MGAQLLTISESELSKSAPKTSQFQLEGKQRYNALSTDYFNPLSVLAKLEGIG